MQNLGQILYVSENLLHGIELIRIIHNESPFTLRFRMVKTVAEDRVPLYACLQYPPVITCKFCYELNNLYGHRLNSYSLTQICSKCSGNRWRLLSVQCHPGRTYCNELYYGLSGVLNSGNTLYVAKCEESDECHETCGKNHIHMEKPFREVAVCIVQPVITGTYW
jgi:hypothetical protein